MGDLFKALTGSLSRFVFAWMIPSVVTLGVFWLFLFDAVHEVWPFREIASAGKSDPVESGLLFVFFVLVLSILFAYSSLPIYRPLEGYSLPARVKATMQRRHQREWHRLQWHLQRENQTGQPMDGLIIERMNYYPVTLGRVAPTRLGNALKAMESFGVTRYGLDSQSLWYELQAVVPETTRRQTEEGRAPVDFFVSSIAHMSLLSAGSLLIAVTQHDLHALLLFSGTAAVVPLSYRLAVKNVKDWTGSVRALVNLGRRPLAERLGLNMPSSLGDEKEMWASFLWAIEGLDAGIVPLYDHYRMPAQNQPSRRRGVRIAGRR